MIGLFLSLPEPGINGDRDPISAGSAGEAVGRGGSRAVVEMTANPIGAH